MPSRMLIVLGLMTGVLFIGACSKEAPEAQAPDTPETSDVATVPEKPDVPTYDSLHDLMEDLGDHYKFLRRNAESAEPEAMLEHTAMIRALALQAKDLTPEQVDDAPEEERAALTQTFHEHLGKLGPALDTLEAAIRSGDRAAAKDAVHELHEVEEHGHEALGVEDDH